MDEMNDDSEILRKRIQQTNSSTWFQYLTAYTGSIGVFIAGMCLGWMGPMYLIFLGENPPFNVTASELSWTTSLTSLSAIPGTIFCALVADIIGRKTLLLLSAFPYITGWLLIYFSTNVTMLNIARIINGIANGNILSAVPMYIGEISSPEIRGCLANFAGLQLKLGILFAYFIGSYLPFRVGALVFVSIPVIYFCLFLWMPESPYFYLIHKNELKAANSLRILRGKSFNVDGEICIMTDFLNKSRKASKKSTFWELLNIKSNRRALLITLSLMSIKFLSGVSALTIFVSILIKELGNSLRPETANMIFGVVSLATLFVSGLLVDLIGRRMLMMISALSTSIGMFVVGIFFYLKHFDIMDVSHWHLIPTVILMTFPFTYGIGLISLPLVYMSEVFATEFKAIASSISLCYASFTSFLVLKMFYTVQKNFGLHTILLFFGVCALIGARIIYRYVPETKRQRLEDIQVKLQNQSHDR